MQWTRVRSAHCPLVLDLERCRCRAGGRRNRCAGALCPPARCESGTLTPDSVAGRRSVHRRVDWPSRASRPVHCGQSRSARIDDGWAAPHRSREASLRSNVWRFYFYLDALL
jgi:hypothetical protein